MAKAPSLGKRAPWTKAVFENRGFSVAPSYPHHVAFYSRNKRVLLFAQPLRTVCRTHLAIQDLVPGDRNSHRNTQVVFRSSILVRKDFLFPGRVLGLLGPVHWSRMPPEAKAAPYFHGTAPSATPAAAFFGQIPHFSFGQDSTSTESPAQ